MAASIVSMRIWRSIPFSLATWSMMWPRLPSYAVSDAAMTSPVAWGWPLTAALRSPVGGLDAPGCLPVESQPAALDLRRVEPVLLAVAFEDDHAFFHSLETPAEDTLSVHRLPELHFRVAPG